LYLLEYILSFRARSIHCFLVNFSVGSGEWRLDQNVSDIHLLGNAMLVPVLIVIALKVLLRDLRLRKHFRIIEDNVFQLPFFWDRIDVAIFVAIVEGLQLGLCWL